MSKIRIGVLFGGRSAEHEISILSARSILNGLDPERYEPVPLAITREGRWLSPGNARAALEAGKADAPHGAMAICPAEAEGTLVHRGSAGATPEFVGLDVVFPILHGTYGEDGTVQGLLEMAGIPYVGAGVCGSALGMDKALMKDVWRAAGLPVLPYRTVLRARLERGETDAVVEECTKALGATTFVKPANLGSSVGIRRATTPEELRDALHHAAEFDRKIVVEMAAEAPREIEVGVLGNDEPEVSVPGEVVHSGPAFYDYHTKYWSGDNPDPLIPAPLSAAETEACHRLARLAWRALDLNGLARVDFLLDSRGTLWLNEVNTMPGFTPFSMFGRLWEATGVPYPQLLDRLVQLAFERFEDRRRNKVSPAADG